MSRTVQPVKLMYLMQRAPHLTRDEFRLWWLERHMPDIRRLQGAYLVGYRISMCISETGDLAGRPAFESQWDGVAELWYRDAAALAAAYQGAEAAECRQDTLAHVARLERLVVEQRTILDLDETALKESVE